MNNSTENVTLFAVFVNDILKNYEGKEDEYPELFSMVKDLDLSNPFNTVPMAIYNEMCAWIEDNLGRFNLIRVGRNVGESAYMGMRANKLITEEATPHQIMEALVKVAAEMIQDPEKRGWEIVESKPNSIQMRRTQTFNSQLQLGLLDGLIRKSKVGGVTVDYVKKIEDGHEFDEYLVSWA